VCVCRDDKRERVPPGRDRESKIWPVPCDGAIDREAITADRDQLWAEALALYDGGVRWYPDAALRALCAPEAADRRIEDRGCPEFSNGHAIPTAWSLASTVARIRRGGRWPL